MTITNVFQNHYHYGYPIGNQDCPSGYNIPSGQYPSTYHLERGHAIHHLDPQSSANDYWVYWAHFDNSSYGIAEVAIFKSTAECGPYILQTGFYPAYNTDGSGYGFQPGGWQSRDENIYRDAATQTYNADGSVATYANSYFVTATNSLNTQKSSSGSTCSYANDSDAIFKMTPDYLGIDNTTHANTNGANFVFICDQREAPVMLRSGNFYFLVVSQAAGWYPSQGGYGVSSNPLTGWTPDPLALGNTSTFAGQTSDGFTIAGTQANTYVLTFDHLGGNASNDPATGERTDTGEMWLPLILDGNAGTATLNWESSWSVDNTTGILTLPTFANAALNKTAKSTVLTAAASGSTTYVPGDAFDGVYTTKWQGSLSGSSAFGAAAPVTDTNNGSTTTLCPITDATATTTCNPSLIVDLGSVQPVQELDLSFYMVKGSEPYYTYKIEYSSDGTTWTTNDYTAFAAGSNSTVNNIGAVPFSNNYTFGFNALPVNFSARYVALTETGVYQQNSSTPFYSPNTFEMAVIASTAPATPASASVTVSPSVSSVAPTSSFTVSVAVSGPAGQPTPSGYIQLSAPGYSAEIYGLVNGTNSYTIPAGVLQGGAQTLTVSYRPDSTSAPVYGLGTVTGAATVTVTAPAAPTNLVVTPSSPAALTVSYTAAASATSYTLYRSLDNGSTYTQLTTTSSTSYLDTGLTNGTTYCYTVTATNASGTSPQSTSACGTATANFPVTNVAVMSTAPNTLTVSYTAVASATSYVIKRSVAGGAYTQLATPTTTSYADTGLTSGTQYCYTVAAVFSTGTGADSSPVCATAATSFPPSNVAATPWATGSVRITYSAPTATASSYLIKRSTGGAYTQIGTSTTLAYTDAAVTGGGTYCYTVDAVVSGYTSADTSPACLTQPPSFVTVNGNSFESPSTTTYVYAPAINGTAQTWTFTASGTAVGSGVTTNSSAFTSSNSSAPLGSQVGFIQGLGVAYQTISDFTAGQTYTMCVAMSQRQNKTGGQIGNTVEYRFDGTAFAKEAPPQSISSYVDYCGAFTATAISHVIGIYGTNANKTSTYTDDTVFVDNVRLYANSAAAQTISFTQPASPAYVGSSATLTATGGSSGSPVTFTIVSGPATLSGTNNSTITYTGAGTVVIAANQAAGNGYASAAQTTRNVTVTNQSVFVINGSGSVSSLYDSGAAQSTNTSGGGLGAAVDGSGNVWSLNSGGNSVTEFTGTGALMATYTGGGMSNASALAVDGASLIWIANGGSVTALSSTGESVFGSALASAGGVSFPRSISVDTAGSIWLANPGSNTVTEIIGVATPAVAPTVTGVANSTLGARP